MTATRSMRKKRKKIRWGRWITTFIILIILAVVSYFTLDILHSAENASSKIYQKINTSKKYRDQEVEITKEPFTILLAGIDTQGGGNGRSDVLMLLTVNPQTKQIYELSIPRDSRVYVPEADKKTKITSSFSYGGIESTIGAINEILDVPIDYYITTNFEGFEDIVDTLDGVKVDVPFTFKAQLTRSLKWKTFYQGNMELNGNQALAYVRMRKSDPRGDFGRNERQKQVVKALIDEGTSIRTIPKIDNILDDLGDNVKTNIPPSKLASFIELYSKLKSTKINNIKLGGHDEYINNIYYYIPEQSSLDEINSTLRGVLKLDNSTTSNS
jgi:polyisoprenyl-teichoic acid--peptidoglycan teichoic acid transferase